jgi:hypothetical protein
MRRHPAARLGVIIGLAAIPGSAWAHPGAHHHLTMAELIDHLATPWHVSVLAAVALLGLAAAPASRRWLRAALDARRHRKGTRR